MSENGEQENQPEENQENQSQNNEIINQVENNNQGSQDLKEDSSKKLTHGHELLSEEENKKYFLEFINKNDLIKIFTKRKRYFSI